ncbi:tandem-95 repeat protein [Anaeromicropila populeti]|uniref:VCBS repeat-containing protein n=1 Tax=Anaeromicropila populeti TaxID=37658 RepID=A0A1I6LC11_9FIRM|nr:Ig-like domain-containing protein [Anaeromicropila populeti]SFS00788.1 VCBS repeat-containing protein [Anaeromicropila populeti]
MRKRTLKVTCVIVLAAILINIIQFSPITKVHAASLDTNLLVNPGGDAGNSTANGWTGASGYNSNTNNLRSTAGGRTGNYFGTFSQGYVDSEINNYQDIDISSQAAKIDSSTLMVNFSGYYMKTGAKSGDYIKVKIQQFDGSGNELYNEEKSCGSTTTYSSISWEQFQIVEAVAAGARKIRITLLCFLTYPGGIGAYTYAGYDDMSVILYENGDIAPSVSQIADQSGDSGTQIGPFSFTASDMDNAVGTLTVSASSSNQLVITNSNINVSLSNGNGSISVTSTSGQTGTANITVSVSDGTKATNMIFKVTVYPNIQLGSNIVSNSDGTTLDGWTNSESRMYTNGGVFIVGSVSSGQSKYYVYQDIDIAKFGSIIDTGLLEFNSSYTNVQSGECKVEGYDGTGNLLWTKNSGTISSGTRKIRVTMGGSVGARIDNVSVVISNATVVSVINDQTLKAGATANNIPFTAVYSGSDITLTGTSSNNSIVNSSSITFEGSGYYRNISFTAQAGVSGTAEISVKVNGTVYRNFQVTVYTCPGKPSITAVTDSSDGIMVSFNGPASDGGSSINSYIVTSGDGSVTATGTYSPIKVTGLTAGNSYTFSVKAKNAAGEGEASDSSESIIFTSIPTVNTESITSITSTSAAINGNVVSDNGSAILERGIEYKKATDLNYTKVIFRTSTTGSFSIRISSLSNNTSYEVRTYATNAKGTNYSSVATFVTLNNMAPTINCSIDLCVINEDSSTADLGEINLTINDEETLADNLTVTASSNNKLLVPEDSAHIIVEGTGANRKIKIIPAKNQSGTAIITVTVTDEQGAFASDTFQLGVNSINDAPVALDSTISTFEDMPKGGMLSASDIENDVLTYQLVSGTSKGTITLQASGSYMYVPNKDVNGMDYFTYKVSDGNLYSSTVTVTIEITSVNDIPVANDSFFTINEDTEKTGALTGMDIDGNTLAFSKTVESLHGSVTINSNGTFQYMPDANYNGIDRFEFKVNDGLADSLAATVTINITAVNDAPVAQDRVLNVTEDEDEHGMLWALDVDGDALNYQIVSVPQKGNVFLDANGSYIYLPALNENGVDSFTYRVTDGVEYSNTATVVITIAEVNDIPYAYDKSITLEEDGSSNGSLYGFDVEGTPLVFIKTREANHGTVIVDSNGLYHYVPNENYFGSDSFSYKVSDGVNFSESAVVTVTINSVNDAPVCQNAVQSVLEDATLNGVLSASDVEGDTLTFSVVENAKNGRVSLNEDGSYSYTPDNNYFGNDSFSFSTNDGTANSNVAEVSITVTSVNDLPEVADINKSVYENQLVYFTATDFTQHFLDVESDALTKIKITFINNLDCGTWKLVSGSTSTTIAAGQEIEAADLNKICFITKANTCGTTYLLWKGSDGTGYSDMEAGVEIKIKEMDSTEITPVHKTESQDLMIYRQISSDINGGNKLILNAGILKAAKTNEKGLSIVVKDKNQKECYTWMFAKDQLLKAAEEMEDINLGMQLKSQEAGVTVSFEENDKLPVSARVNINLEDQPGIVPGSKVNVYHYNETTKKYETLPYSSNYYVSEDGSVSINIVQGGTYVVLSNKLSAQTVTTLKNQIKVKSEKSKLKLGQSTKVKVTLPVTLQSVKSLKSKTDSSAIGAATVSYSSSNKQVATVNKSGQITSVGVGKTIITTTIKLYNGQKKIVKETIIVSKS